MTEQELQTIRGRWEKLKAQRLPHSGAVRLTAPDVSMIDCALAGMERLVNAGRLEEREACARLVDAAAAEVMSMDDLVDLPGLAAAIRARTETPQ